MEEVELQVEVIPTPNPLKVANIIATRVRMLAPILAQTPLLMSLKMSLPNAEIKSVKVVMSNSHTPLPIQSLVALLLLKARRWRRSRYLRLLRGWLSSPAITQRRPLLRHVEARTLLRGRVAGSSRLVSNVRPVFYVYNKRLALLLLVGRLVLQVFKDEARLLADDATRRRRRAAVPAVVDTGRVLHLSQASARCRTAGTRLVAEDAVLEAHLLLEDIIDASQVLLFLLIPQVAPALGNHVLLACED